MGHVAYSCFLTFVAADSLGGGDLRSWIYAFTAITACLALVGL